MNPTKNTASDARTNDTAPSFPALSDVTLLTAELAARYLSLSISYLRKAVAANRIPFVRIGTRTLFRRIDLDTWISEHIVPTYHDVQNHAERLAATAMLNRGKVVA